MKPAISLFSMALIAVFAFISPCFAQNVTINLEPINPPIQIPGPGGSFDYNVTVSNTGASSQTFYAWIMVQLPGGSWYGPVLGPVNLTLPGGASISRQRTQPVPESAPSGTYVYQGRVGVYPGTVWDTSSFTFAKTLEGSELWVARYNGLENGNDQAYDIAVDSNGSIYVTGLSFGYGPQSGYATIKYNPSGNQLWVAFYHTGSAKAIAVDVAGNVYVTGASIGGGADDYATVKYDSNGTQLWVARYDGGWGNLDDQAQSLAVDSDGNVLVTGYSQGSQTFRDYATIKYDMNGNQLWVARYDGPGNDNDEATSLAVDGAGNVYVTGYSYGSGTGADYATIKYNAAGVQQWVARYNGPGNSGDGATSMALDETGNVYVTGSTFNIGSYSNYATIKYNSAGLQQWVALYNGPGNAFDGANSIALDSSGNVYVTGESSWYTTFPYNPDYDYATIKYDENGNELWVARYRGLGNSNDMASSIAVDEVGNAYVTGCGGGVWGIGNYDYVTVKYNTAGLQQWVAIYNGPGNYNDEATSLAIDGAGNVYVTGNSYSSEYTYDYATIKYSGGNPSIAGSNWQPVEALVFGAQEAVTEYKLNPCYPNPFNATTAISCELRAASYVKLEVFDISGRLVSGSGATPTTVLVDGWREAGEHELTYEAGDLPSGVYFCKMQAGDFTAIGKMVLLK